MPTPHASPSRPPAPPHAAALPGNMPHGHSHSPTAGGRARPRGPHDPRPPTVPLARPLRDGPSAWRPGEGLGRLDITPEAVSPKGRAGPPSPPRPGKKHTQPNTAPHAAGSTAQGREGQPWGLGEAGGLGAAPSCPPEQSSEAPLHFWELLVPRPLQGPRKAPCSAASSAPATAGHTRDAAPPALVQHWPTVPPGGRRRPSRHMRGPPQGGRWATAAATGPA